MKYLKPEIKTDEEASINVNSLLNYTSNEELFEEVQYVLSLYSLTSQKYCILNR